MIRESLRSQKGFLHGLIVLLGMLFSSQMSSQTFCIDSLSDHVMGVKDGYRYELWNQNSQGVACMTIGKGALFSGKWSGIENYLARRGFGFDRTKEHQELGTFTMNYKCTYQPTEDTGNSYLSVYGWTLEPLAEYYIIENWCRWIPSMAKDAVFKGTVEVNGSIYDIYEYTRVNQPSIVGNTTFQQYFSIRRDKRNSGTINITDHFKKWEALGMNLGKLYEVSMVVEGYQSSGDFKFKKLEVLIDK